MVAHFHRLYTSKRSSGNYFGTREQITFVQTFHLVRPKLENVSRARMRGGYQKSLSNRDKANGYDTLSNLVLFDTSKFVR